VYVYVLLMFYFAAIFKHMAIKLTRTFAIRFMASNSIQDMYMTTFRYLSTI